MKLDARINIRHLTRVEGHGNISIKVKDGRLTEARWEVVETPRFFEAILIGKKWYNAPWISGRICGICSIGHTLASIRAVENAFGIKPGPLTVKLRTLLKHMETLQSHILHLYFLAAPDFMGEESIFPLVHSAPDIAKRAADLKLLANDLSDLVGGRRIHPTTTVVGGFTKFPDKKSLGAFRPRLVQALLDLDRTVELFGSFEVPEFERETEYVSLKGSASYPFIGGELVSSDGVINKESDYRSMTNEYTVGHSTSKWCRLSRDSFAVGALARVNNNFGLLHPKAREAASALALETPCRNPYMNNHAQLIECVHVVEDSIYLMDELLGSGAAEPRAGINARAGRGVGAVEVPRGILYHCYEFDRQGTIRKCDCVIPTGQNHANIQIDLEELAKKCLLEGKTDREIELLASMLVRSYDPCISCSVH